MELEIQKSHVFEEAGVEELNLECQKLLPTLRKEKFWDGCYLYLYQGFWFRAKALQAVVHYQNHFQAEEEDVLLITTPKSGTTWLKALAFAITNRKHCPISQNPFLDRDLHQLVRFLEFDLYYMRTEDPTEDLRDLARPRMIAGHVPYELLPPCVKDSKCRIVYMCRNPVDKFISLWHFINLNRPEEMKKILEDSDSDSVVLETGLEMMCRGVDVFGPFWNHVLGYWKMSIERPDKVLFLKYEDMKRDSRTQLKRLAHFLGVPFSQEEEGQGMIEEILRLCSFDSLRNNANGMHVSGVKNSSFYRKGEVGEWINHVNPSIVERVENLIEEKLSGSGLSFKS